MRPASRIRAHRVLRNWPLGVLPPFALARHCEVGVDVRGDSDALADCLVCIASLHERLPEVGRDVAIDGSDLPAYANGQRFLSKNGPEREKFSDPDASWGHRSAVSTRKGGGF
jgi:hypothetical protein